MAIKLWATEGATRGKRKRHNDKRLFLLVFGYAAYRSRTVSDEWLLRIRANALTGASSALDRVLKPNWASWNLYSWVISKWWANRITLRRWDTRLLGPKLTTHDEWPDLNIGTSIFVCIWLGRGSSEPVVNNYRHEKEKQGGLDNLSCFETAPSKIVARDILLWSSAVERTSSKSTGTDTANGGVLSAWDWKRTI